MSELCGNLRKTLQYFSFYLLLFLSVFSVSSLCELCVRKSSQVLFPKDATKKFRTSKRAAGCRIWPDSQRLT